MKTNPTFVQDLETLLKNFEQEKARRRHTVENAHVKVKGDFHMGDKSGLSNDNPDERHTIKGSTIEIEGDFHLGDG